MGRMTQNKGQSLGELIAFYRKRRRSMHGEGVWSQDELAFAIGSTQSHISLIESDRKHPQYITLARICDALELSPTERAHVLSVGGYQSWMPLPEESSVNEVLSKLASFLEARSYPCWLIDDAERIWHFNYLAAVVFGAHYGTSDHVSLMSMVRGKRILELLFSGKGAEAILLKWRANYENADDVLDRLIVQFWRACCARPYDLSMTALVDNLRKHPDFVRRWERVERGEIDILFVERGHVTYHHPTLGVLKYSPWRTHLAADERFLVVHLVPTDDDTRGVFSALASREGEKRDDSDFPAQPKS